MKIRLICILLCLSFCLMLFSCEKSELNYNQAKIGEECEISFVDFTNITKCEFSMESKDLLQLIISKEELESFKAQNEFVVVKEEEWEQFNEEYFLGKALIVINIVKTYSGPEYSIYSVATSDDSLHITISSINEYYFVNDMMYCVFFVIGISQNDISNISNVDINYHYSKK